MRSHHIFADAVPKMVSVAIITIITCALKTEIMRNKVREMLFKASLTQQNDSFPKFYKSDQYF